MSSPESMAILRAVKTLNLPDWAIGAGFVRSLVWDRLHGDEYQTPLTDVDVLYFDSSAVEEAIEKDFESHLSKLLPAVPWSVKNQARMHIKNGDTPYASTLDAMAHWLETPTAVGVRYEQNLLRFLAPYGLSDLCDMVIRPTPSGLRAIENYRRRVLTKPWLTQWPKVQVIGLYEKASVMEKS